MKNLTNLTNEQLIKHFRAMVLLADNADDAEIRINAEEDEMATWDEMLRRMSKSEN